MIQDPTRTEWLEGGTVEMHPPRSAATAGDEAKGLGPSSRVVTTGARTGSPGVGFFPVLALLQLWRRRRADSG